MWGSGALSLCSWAPGNHRSGFHDFQLPGYVLCHNLQEEEEKEKESEVKEEKVKGEKVKEKPKELTEKGCEVEDILGFDTIITRYQRYFMTLDRCKICQKIVRNA